MKRVPIAGAELLVEDIGEPKRGTIILVHGGPVAMPDDADFILKNCTACHGFYGASSMERLPAEIALTEQTRAFKRITGR